MMACTSCGARNPNKNGHHWGCKALAKKAEEAKKKKEKGK